MGKITMLIACYSLCTYFINNKEVSTISYPGVFTLLYIGCGYWSRKTVWFGELFPCLSIFSPIFSHPAWGPLVFSPSLPFSLPLSRAATTCACGAHPRSEVQRFKASRGLAELLNECPTAHHSSLPSHSPSAARTAGWGCERVPQGAGFGTG